ncbi:histidinol-phosphate transaminase [Baaleninema sp.]|uniref:histidinol-phosphate transaminase n=1 Tax=Baaleninema sp. TaxID=3101197 RepID=UPI003D03B199
MLPFVRSDLARLTAYTPNPGHGEEAEGSPRAFDRLDTNESPYDLPADFKQKLADTYCESIEANRYPDGSHGDLRRLVAEYVNESASTQHVTAQNISIGNGSDELIRSILIATCLQGQGSLLLANPTFSMYGILAQTLGIPVVSVDRSPEDFAIDLEAAQQAIDNTSNPPIRAVFVVHPNSPTANALTETELEWLRSLPEEILVVVDEAYFEFSQRTVVPERRSNWVVLRTFSKAFRLAAHRVGYAIADPEFIAVLEKLRLPYNLPSFSQAAARTALLLRGELLGVIPDIVRERDRLLRELLNLPQLRLWRSSSNFIYCRSTVDSMSNEAIAQELYKAGTLIRHTGGGLRITVGTPEENARTLDRLHGILQQ